jgi:putative ABC transport system permease protein
MGIKLIKGRYFSERDDQKSQLVAIINQTAARRFWPDEDPIGKRIRLEGSSDWISIIGITQDVKQGGLQYEVRPEILLHYLQRLWGSAAFLVLRTDSDPIRYAALVKQEIWNMDRSMALPRAKTMNQILEESLEEPRFGAILLVSFAVAALALAAIGVYGVMSYSVAQRTHEIGIRMAVGASSGDVLKLILTGGLKLTLIGVVAGLVGSMALTRFMSNLLYGVSATDPSVFLITAALLVSVALMACYIPARRAARVDPLLALRYE